jgi:hypothetical protein
VVTAVRRDIVDKTVLEARTDLIDHPYFIVVDVVERGRRTRVVNCYDIWLGASHTYAGATQRNRRALTDVNWDPIFSGRCLILRDFNAHSPMWNSLITDRKDAKPLEDLIVRHDLFVNNAPDMPTRPYKIKSSRGGGGSKKEYSLLIIDLTISNQALGPLASWETEEGLTTSDHLAIWASWEPPYGDKEDPGEVTITGWQIGALAVDEEALKAASDTWNELASSQPRLTDSCSPKDIDKEAEWVEESLIKVLNQHTKPIKLCARSKH